MHSVLVAAEWCCLLQIKIFVSGCAAEFSSELWAIQHKVCWRSLVLQLLSCPCCRCCPA